MKSGITMIKYTGNKKYVINFPISLENNVPANGAITVKRISKPIKPTKTLRTLDSRFLQVFYRNTNKRLILIVKLKVRGQNRSMLKRIYQKFLHLFAENILKTVILIYQTF